MSLFGPYFVFLRDFGAHLTRLACRFSIYIKYKKVIGLEIFSRKILLHMTNSLHCPESARNLFAGSALHIFVVVVVVSETLKSIFSGLKYV